jgi:hypothetical protein
MASVGAFGNPEWPIISITYGPWKRPSRAQGPRDGASGLIEMKYEILKLSYEEFT